MGDSFLGWLGFRRAADIELASEDASEGLPTPQQRSRNLRGQVIVAIGDFLIDHDLEITPQNLALAHGVVSGLNPRLKRKVAALQASGRAITQDWLNLATASEVAEDDSRVEQLIRQLEETISQFRQTTQTAQTATREYGDALELHVDQLGKKPAGKPEAGNDATAVIAELATYARAMLKRSRKAEAELKHSEEEAAGLRHNLDRARRDAAVDFLTGLPNRRAFEAELERNLTEAREAGEPLSVAFCDIDHFKLVNDTHGHEAGDRVICAVAKTLTEISADRCHIARHGGEEFVLLFRGQNIYAAAEALDAARAGLAARRLVNRRSKLPFGQITFSGGVADVFAFATPGEALAAADEALYRAKEGGRNRIELAEQAKQARAA